MISLAVGAIVGTVLVLVIPATQGWSVRVGAALDGALLSALVHPWMVIASSTPETTRQRAAVDYPGRALLAMTKLLVSVAGLVAAVWLLRPPAPHATKLQAVLAPLLGSVAIAASWAFLHTSYALRYAHEYYYFNRTPGGLRFTDGPPDDLDFAYFSFTIGMTFQTSDTEVTTHRMRRIVLGHALLAFVFDTIIVALSINLIAGRI